eukprot:1159840-Pelagomonas_calceolata.AAC.9
MRGWFGAQVGPGPRHQVLRVAEGGGGQAGTRGGGVGGAAAGVQRGNKLGGGGVDGLVGGGLAHEGFGLHATEQGGGLAGEQAAQRGRSGKAKRAASTHDGRALQA